jgi:hypothetical protein
MLRTSAQQALNKPYIPGRSQHQHNKSLSPLQVWLVVAVDDAREKVPMRLPRPSLSNPYHVLACQCEGESL